jgi:energy-coupling factor transporter ATP-binding protein EcfA2
VRLTGIRHAYDGGPEVLHGVDLEVAPGERVAVVGASGAGKSTLAYALAGFVPHFYHGTLTGAVNLAGRDTRVTPLPELVQIAGLVFQNPFNQISGTKFTVREEIAFGLENLGLPRVEMLARISDVLDVMQIADLADRSPLALSGGQMQRVALAAVLAMHPPVLVLDEPTAQLDPVGSREVFAAVGALAARHDTTVVIIEHKLEWIARYCHRLLALADGALVADGIPSEVLADERLLAWGVGNLRYTQAARRARELGAWPQGRPLPVTLDDAAAGFRQAR